MFSNETKTMQAKYSLLVGALKIVENRSTNAFRHLSHRTWKPIARAIFAHISRTRSLTLSTYLETLPRFLGVFHAKNPLDAHTSKNAKWRNAFIAFSSSFYASKESEDMSRQLFLLLRLQFSSGPFFPKNVRNVKCAKTRSRNTLIKVGRF